MRVVVLYTQQADILLRKRPFGGQIIRMKIVGNDFRLDLENSRQMFDRFTEKSETLHILEIPDVLAQEGEVASSQADRALELSSYGKDRRKRATQLQGCRHIPSRSANLPHTSRAGSHDRIITTKQDVSIVYQEIVRNTGQGASPPHGC